MNILNVAIGWVMKLCYSISFQNYILTLFFFALIMQIILFPFGIKQQKSSVKLASIRPKEEAIRAQYRGRNDRATMQKMNMEIQELYRAEGYSPTAGCLPLLIQMPIILAIFGVARAPLTYTTDLNNTAVTNQEDGKGYNLNDFYQHAYNVIDNQIEAYEGKKADLEAAKSAEGADTAALDKEIKEVEKKIKTLQDTLDKKGSDGKTSSGLIVTSDPYRQIKLIKFMQKGVDSFAADFVDENGKLIVKGSDVVTVQKEKASYSDYQSSSYADKLIIKEDAVAAYEGAKVYDFNAMLDDKFDSDEKEALKNDGTFENYANLLPNFEFIGGTSTLDQPSIYKFNWLLLIPILVFLSSYWSGEVTRKLTTQPQVAEGQPNPANSGFMRWGMPIMSTWFSVTFPAAIGIYWIFRSVFSVAQQYILVKMYPAPKFTEEELKVAVAEQKKAKKRKKIVTIEVDEDDTSYDELAISEERAEKIRRRQERQQRENARGTDAEESKQGGIEKPVLKDDADRKD